VGVYLKIVKTKMAGMEIEMIGHLPTKHEALSSTPNVVKKKMNKVNSRKIRDRSKLILYVIIGKIDFE
jgi:hypothetical protein